MLALALLASRSSELGGAGVVVAACTNQLRLLQEQLDARACVRLCWLQMEGPYRLCRLGPYITPPSPKKEERGCTFMFVAIELFCQHGLAQVVSKDLKQGLAVVRCCC